jgi:hypothetical protein
MTTAALSYYGLSLRNVQLLVKSTVLSWHSCAMPALLGSFDDLVLRSMEGMQGRTTEDTKIIGILEQMPKSWNRNLIDSSF